ncbi:hypothetical protein ACWU37_20640 [Photobacterium damselae subsp. damselae]
MSSNSKAKITPEIAIGYKKSHHAYNVGYKNHGYNIEYQYYNYLTDYNKAVLLGGGINNKINNSYLSVSFEYGSYMKFFDSIQFGTRYNFSGEMNFYIQLRYLYSTDKMNTRSLNLITKDNRVKNSNNAVSLSISNFEYYNIIPGDTLSEICDKQKWNMSIVPFFNSYIKNLDFIYPGDILRYPKWRIDEKAKDL